jgi:hypothetical protein
VKEIDEKEKVQIERLAGEGKEERTNDSKLKKTRIGIPGLD